jgi:hypothetical protein
MEDENEGMSTKKKVAAGAALGVAVPAAVAVGKKILGGEDSGDEAQQGQTSRTRKQATGRRSTGRRSTGRGSTKSTASSRSSARSRTAKSKGSTGSRGERTKEQLYTQAKRLKIKGRSNMTKAQLQRAVARKSS